MVSVDLSVDLGEGALPAAQESALLELVTSASIACGFHAGSPSVMRLTLEAALEHGVVVGAHPSYPDREGFGRVELALPPARIAEDVLYQVGALDGLARSLGTSVRYVKPHGALYNRMAVDHECAAAVCDAVRSYGALVLLVPAGSVAVDVATELGVDVATEVFADRAYLADGRLAPRTMPGALVTEPAEAARRAVGLAVDGCVPAVDGGTIELEGNSICLHGDTPGALRIAEAVLSELREAGIEVAPFVS